MLDLKSLEKKLDAALAKETEQSLSQWLNSKRNKMVYNNLGFGQYESKKTIHGKFFVSWGSYAISNSAEDICTVSNDRYPLAA